jgi:GTP cyclohydrolase I
MRTTRDEALNAVRILLSHLGEDPNRPGLRDTPRRVVDALLEMTSSPDYSPTVFEEQNADEIVVVRGIRFSSLCEHHLIAFTGTASVGYLPNGRVIGISKIPRIVEKYARRLQLQERLCRQVAEELESVTGAVGVGVVLTAEHQCMACRGVRQPDAETLTSSMRGVFRDNPAARAELLSLLGLR